MSSPFEAPDSPSRGPSRLRPSLFLGLWLLCKAFFDALILLAARQSLLPLPEVTPLILAWSVLEIVAALLAALGLLERSPWGWRAAVGLTLGLVAVGTASVAASPPPDRLLVVGVAYSYHAAMLGALHLNAVRRDLLGEKTASRLPWLGSAAGILLGIGFGCLGFRFGGVKGALPAVAWAGWILLREAKRSRANGA